MNHVMKLLDNPTFRNKVMEKLAYLDYRAYPQQTSWMDRTAYKRRLSSMAKKHGVESAVRSQVQHPGALNSLIGRAAKTMSSTASDDVAKALGATLATGVTTGAGIAGHRIYNRFNKPSLYNRFKSVAKSSPKAVGAGLFIAAALGASKIENFLSSRDRQKGFVRMMKEHPDLGKQNKMHVLQVYNALWELNPRIAKEPTSAATFIRSQLSVGPELAMNLEAVRGLLGSRATTPAKDEAKKEVVKAVRAGLTEMLVG